MERFINNQDNIVKVIKMKVEIEAYKVWTKKTDTTGRLSGLPANTEVIVAIEKGTHIPPQILPSGDV